MRKNFLKIVILIILVSPFLVVVYQGYLINRDKIYAHKNDISVPQGVIRNINIKDRPQYLFTPKRNNLKGIDIVFVNSKGLVNLILKDEQGAILSKMAGTDKILNYGYYKFRFPVIRNSKDKKYFLEINTQTKTGVASVVENAEGQILAREVYDDEISFVDYYERLIDNSTSFIRK